IRISRVRTTPIKSIRPPSPSLPSSSLSPSSSLPSSSSLSLPSSSQPSSSQTSSSPLPSSPSLPSSTHYTQGHNPLRGDSFSRHHHLLYPYLPHPKKPLVPKFISNPQTHIPSYINTATTPNTRSEQSSNHKSSALLACS